MYWISNAKESNAIDGYMPAVIEKSYMDGSRRTVIANLTGAKEANSLTYDQLSKRLYWVEKENKLIRCLELDNPVPKKLISSQLEEPYDIAIHGEYIYWTDGGTGSWSGGVYRAYKNNGSGIEQVVDILGKPMGLYSRDSSRSIDAGMK